METIKSYTDIPQSKKLAEMLPIESADMWWIALNWQETEYYVEVKQDGINQPKKAIPCWSLASLLNILPKKYYPIKDHKTCLILSKPKDKWCAIYWDATGMQDGEQTLADNPVDACVEMIEKLHELSLL